MAKRTIVEQLLDAAALSDIGHKPNKKDYRRLAAKEITNLTVELDSMNTNYQLLLAEHKELKKKAQKYREIIVEATDEIVLLKGTK